MENRMEYHVLITEEDRWIILNALYRYYYARMQDMYNNENNDKAREELRKELARTQQLIKKLYNL